MKTIRHTGIVVGNLEKALHFYRDLLGLKVVRKMDESGDYMDRISKLDKVKVTTVKMAALDGTLLELLYYHSHPRRFVGKRELCNIGVSHVAFTVENLEREYRRLSKAGIEFNAPPQFSADGYAKVTFCRDPEGNFIELVEELTQ